MTMLKHSKSDIIRIRIAPRVKARIIKEAQKKGVTMSQLIRARISE